MFELCTGVSFWLLRNIKCFGLILSESYWICLGDGLHFLRLNLLDGRYVGKEKKPYLLRLLLLREDVLIWSLLIKRCSCSIHHQHGSTAPLKLERDSILPTICLLLFLDECGAYFLIRYEALCWSGEMLEHSVII